MAEANNSLDLSNENSIQKQKDLSTIQEDQMESGLEVKKVCGERTNMNLIKRC